MATVRASLTDNSTRDDTDDDINGAEVDANPQYIADVIDGTITDVALNQVGNVHWQTLPWTEDFRADRVEVYNDSPATITDLTLLYVSGYDTTNALWEVSAAQAKDPANTSLFALLVADGAISPSSSGYACKRITTQGDQDTSGLTVGRHIYLSPTAGEWTGTRPAAGTGVQIVGKVAEVDAASGSIILEPGPVIPWTVADQV